MLQINIRETAEDDLSDIWLFIFERWGEKQAIKYLNELNQGIHYIAVHSMIGVDYSEVSDGFRKLLINHQTLSIP